MMAITVLTLDYACWKFDDSISLL